MTEREREGRDEMDEFSFILPQCIDSSCNSEDVQTDYRYIDGLIDRN